MCCYQVGTLGEPDLSSLQDHAIGTQSILTRRLGLIVGCCLGFVVFILLVSILGYLKVSLTRVLNKYWRVCCRLKNRGVLWNATNRLPHPITCLIDTFRFRVVNTRIDQDIHNLSPISVIKHRSISFFSGLIVNIT